MIITIGESSSRSRCAVGSDAPLQENQTRWQRAGVLANPLRDFLLFII